MFKHKNTKVYPNKEILLNNFVDADFRRFLKPLNILQSLFLYPKYVIRDNFITPSGWDVNLVSFLATSVYISLLVVRGFYRNPVTRSIVFTKSSVSKMFKTSRIINLTLNGLGHINDFHLNRVHSFDNVALVLRLQNVVKNLRYNKKNFKNMIAFNWIYSVIVFSDFYIFYCFVNIWHRRFYLIDLLTDCTMLTFYVNMLYAIRIMVLMNSCLSSWIKEVKLIKKNYIQEKPEYYKKMFEIYASIMESYRIYIKVFQELILQFILDTFFHTLTYMQSWITYTETKNSNEDPVYRVFLAKTLYLIMIWVSKHFMFVAVLGRSTETFYAKLEETQILSSKMLLSLKCDEPEKRMYKNVRRLYKSNFTRVTLKCMFDVDMTLPFQLAGVTTAYVIVLLQFAFLD